MARPEQDKPTIWHRRVEEDLGDGQIYRDTVRVTVSPGTSGKVTVEQDFLYQLLLDAGYELEAVMRDV